MRRHGVKAVTRRRFRTTTQSFHRHAVADNRLNRQFSLDQIASRDRVWAGDITYLATREGWLYLAVVLDLRSRRVIGWSMRHTLDRELAVAALRMAIVGRRPLAGVLYHSDRGVQYACGDFQAILRQFAMECSMSRKGDCWDNAVVESFFATLKTELIDRFQWATREDVRVAVFEYIEIWYNRKRRHSTLGYLSPAEFESVDESAA